MFCVLLICQMVKTSAGVNNEGRPRGRNSFTDAAYHWTDFISKFSFVQVPDQRGLSVPKHFFSLLKVFWPKN